MRHVVIPQLTDELHFDPEQLCSMLGDMPSFTSSMSLICTGNPCNPPPQRVPIMPSTPHFVTVTPRSPYGDAYNCDAAYQRQHQRPVNLRSNRITLQHANEKPVLSPIYGKLFANTATTTVHWTTTFSSDTSPSPPPPPYDDNILTSHPLRPA